MNIEKTLKNISCKEYCNINNFKYSILQKEYSQKIYIPDYRDNTEDNKFIYVKYPETYIAELYNVNLIGGNSIIFDEKENCIYDLPLMDDENRFELKCGSALYVNKDFTIVNYNNSTEVIEEGIMLTSNASFNYFHLNMELMSKLCLINETGQFNKVPLLVDEICLTIPSFKEELQMLNLNRREIIYLKIGCSYNVKKLIYLSDLIISPMNFKRDVMLRYDDYMINDVAVNLLHDKLSINSNIFRKLYISRKYCGGSRLSNQNKIEEIFEEYGYEMVYPEKMSFQDQLKIFSQAEFIAGTSGAGFTNILFANKNAKIICILPKDIKLSCYSNIAGVLGQQCYYLDAKTNYNTSTVHYQNSFELEEEYLKDFLNNFV